MFSSRFSIRGADAPAGGLHRRWLLLGLLGVAALLFGAVLPRGGVQAQSADQATTLRVSLDQLLAEHADLAMLAMQKGYDGAADFQAAADQLTKNTNDLTQAIGSVYGQDAATKFNQLWTQHIGFFVDYTQALKANDAAKKQQALQNLAGYKTQIGAFLSGANPNLPDATVQSVFQTHIDELIGQIDAYAAKNYSQAYTLFDQAHNHMFMAGDALAAAIVKQMPSKFPGSSTSAAANLQLSLDQLLSEHANLAVIAMQKGFDGAPDFQAIAGQLTKNTSDLTQAIGSVYGAGAANQFNQLWTQHIGFFVDYTQAVKANDSAKKQQALQSLAGYKGQIAGLLSGANPNLPNADVQTLFQQHIDQLTGALDAYAGKNYAQVYTLFQQSHDHMFMAGAALAGAIAKQMPSKFPATGMAAMQMPATGSGGLAGNDGAQGRLLGLLAVALAALGVAVGGLTLTRRPSR